MQDYIRECGIPEWTDRLLERVVEAKPESNQITSFSLDVLGEWLLMESQTESLLQTALQFATLAVQAVEKLNGLLDINLQEVKRCPVSSGCIDRAVKLTYMCEALQGKAETIAPHVLGTACWFKLREAGVPVRRGAMGNEREEEKYSVPIVPVNIEAMTHPNYKKRVITEVTETICSPLFRLFPPSDGCSVLITDSQASVVWANGYFSSSGPRSTEPPLQLSLELWGGDTSPIPSFKSPQFLNRNTALFQASHLGGYPWQIGTPYVDPDNALAGAVSSYFPYVTNSGIPLVIGIAYSRKLLMFDPRHWQLSQTFDSSPGWSTLYDLDTCEIVLQNYSSAVTTVSCTQRLRTSNIGDAYPFGKQVIVLDHPWTRFLPHLQISNERKQNLVEQLRNGSAVSVKAKVVESACAAHQKAIDARKAAVVREDGNNEHHTTTAAAAGGGPGHGTTAQQVVHLVHARCIELPNVTMTGKAGKFVIVNEIDISEQDRLHSSLQKTLKQVRTEKENAVREQKKAEALMKQLLPAEIITRLSEKKEIISDKYEDVTLLFADICGFTCWSASVTPLTVVQTLHILISHIDDLTDDFGVEKIKTVGDCYFAAAGVPTRCRDHADRLIKFAVALLQVVETHLKPHHLTMRVGLHSGEVVAGVIGKHKFVFDLWGDAVNTASRMESTGVPGHIQISEQTKGLLQHHKSLNFVPRTVEAKGKGTLKTYLVERVCSIDDDTLEFVSSWEIAQPETVAAPWYINMSATPGTHGSSSLGSSEMDFDVDAGGGNSNFWE